MDLDQAVVITNHNDGYTVYYAIADVAAFVEFDALARWQTNPCAEVKRFIFSTSQHGCFFFGLSREL
nr:hypothetical protein [Corynebacterium diphtheriae]